MYVDTLGAFIPDQFKAASDVWIAVGLMNDKGIEYLRLCKGVVTYISWNRFTYPAISVEISTQ